MRILLLIYFYLLISCQHQPKPPIEVVHDIPALITTAPSIIVLGTTQDAGSPQIGCAKSCCRDLPKHSAKRKVVSLGIVDPQADNHYMIEASPDIVSQLTLLNLYSHHSGDRLPNGIFLTHAHMGHYTGLMYLGKESINSDRLPVYAMPRMHSFLSSNGPWEQLITNGNVDLQLLQDDVDVKLSQDLEVTPILVPHRDEYSETVGYVIRGPNKSALFIPDIDKWSKWEKDIVDLIAEVDYALLDATFYNAEEIGGRDISTIPHPFVIESMELFDGLSQLEKAKIHFIHFNHTNELLQKGSNAYNIVVEKGYKISKIGDVLAL